jgi:hypothetical protein
MNSAKTQLWHQVVSGSPSKFVRWTLAATLALAALQLPRITVAQPASASQQPQVLLLDCEAADGLPACSTLQLALEHELEVAVQLGQPAAGQGALIVRSAGPGRAKVSFALDGGGKPGRVVSLPAEAARAAETIALLAANLMRDDAGELLASLQKRRQAVQIPPAAAPLPAPSPAPAPSPLPAPLPAPAPPSVPLAVAQTPVSADERPVAIAVDLLPGFTLPPGAGQDGVRALSFGPLITFSSHLRGIEAAGVVALKTGRVRGIQVSGVLNVAGQLEAGIQASTVNLAGGPARGIQAGVVNLVGGSLRGIQAGTVNLAGSIQGVQAGVTNLVFGDATGVQAGVFNYAAGRAGWQVGILNLGRDADVGLGLLSLYWDGRTHVQVSTSAAGQTLVALKHGSRRIHNLLAVGAQPDGAQPDGGQSWDPVAALGLGARLFDTGRWYLDLDLQQQVIFRKSPGTTRASQGIDVSTQSQVSALLGLKLWRSLGIFAGPTYQLAIDGNPELIHADVWWRGGTMQAGFMSAQWRDRDVQVRGWPGLTVGVTWL